MRSVEYMNVVLAWYSSRYPDQRIDNPENIGRVRERESATTVWQLHFQPIPSPCNCCCAWYHRQVAPCMDHAVVHLCVSNMHLVVVCLARYCYPCLPLSLTLFLSHDDQTCCPPCAAQFTDIVAIKSQLSKHYVGAAHVSSNLYNTTRESGHHRGPAQACPSAPPPFVAQAYS
jgi:hypothetical protein